MLIKLTADDIQKYGAYLKDAKEGDEVEKSAYEEAIKAYSIAQKSADDDDDAGDDDASDDDASDDDASDDDDDAEQKKFNSMIDNAASKAADKALAKAMAKASKKGFASKDDLGSFSKCKAVTRDFADKMKHVSFEQAEKAGNFIKALINGDQVEAKALSEGVDANGGYLVPTPLLAGVIRAAEDFGLARRFATIRNMTAKTLDITVQLAGVTTTWVDELVAKTESNPTFTRKTLTAKALAVISVASEELLADSATDVWAYVATLVGEDFAREEDKVMLVDGSDISRTALLEDTAVNVFTMGTGDVDFVDLTADDLNDAMRSVLTKYKRGRPQWYMNQAILGVIEKLKDDNGQYIYRQPGANETATLWGFPIQLSDVFPDLSDTAVSTPFILFGDLRWASLGVRQNTTAKVLTEATVGSLNLAESDAVALRVVERVAFVTDIPLAFATVKTAAA